MIMYTHYLQWFTGYLNYIVLLMSHVHFFKETTPLFNVHLNSAPKFLDSGHISWMLDSRRWTLDATL